ncbi:hypothetical protein DRQ25_06110 [Candidatus Fermentibacteria bacterium]|nr:MAG: hypothetical protein DRQ25_06110 [Candidatus Fermentibacteria bacterium]
MRFMFILICIAGVAFASNTDISPNPGTPGAADADLTQLDYFDIEALGASVYNVGVGFDGTNFWVTDGAEVGGSGDNMIHIITGVAPHTLVTSVEQNGTSSWGLRDMCWDGTYMYGSESTIVQYYDASYALAGVYTHSAVSPNRAQGYDGTCFYTGSFSVDIYQVTWDGVSGSSASSTVWSSAVANGGLYGLAWDAGGNCMWASTASSDGMLYQIDAAGALITSYDISPESPTAGGCTMADYTVDVDQLWVLAQGDPDGVYCWQTTVSLERDTWGSIKTVF